MAFLTTRGVFGMRAELAYESDRALVGMVAYWGGALSEEVGDSRTDVMAVALGDRVADSGEANEGDGVVMQFSS